jgi:hypothetical protein
VALAIADGGDVSRGRKPAPPRPVDAAQLARLAGALGHAIYWVGERPGERLQLTRGQNGDLYLRYLPVGAGPGTPGSEFLTISTYPVAGASAALHRAAAESGGRLERAPGGAAMLVAPPPIRSVFLAPPAGDLQVEVYDPRPGAALRLSRTGAVRRVG